MAFISTLAALTLAQAGPAHFAAPVRIEAGGEPIDVTTGHAAPYLYDFDGDGIRDLLVGEFGKEDFSGPVSGEASPGRPWTEGRLRIYRNLGTDAAPRYEGFEYFKAGGRIAGVPITCCVSFVPQFIDYDGDGDDDVLSASYPGDMYLFRGHGDGTWAAAEQLKNEDGDPLVPWEMLPEQYRTPEKDRHTVHSTTAELHDKDGDGDLDLWIGSRLDGCFTIENIGTRQEPVWSRDTRPITDVAGDGVGGWDWGSNVHWHDWDRDGVSDVLVGGENGGVRWLRNCGAENRPKFEKAQVLISDEPRDGWDRKLEVPERSGSRCKVHAADYDGDGMTDLLVGDFGATWHHIHDQTPEEKEEIAKLEAENEALGEKLMPLWNTREELTAEQEQQKADLEAKSRANYDRIEEMRTHDTKWHGWVWLYRQVPAQAGVATGAAD